MEKCIQDLGNSIKVVSLVIVQLLGEVVQGNENYVGIVVWDVVGGLWLLVQVVRGVVVLMLDFVVQVIVFDMVSDVLDKVSSFIEEVKKVVGYLGDFESQQWFVQVVKVVIQVLNCCVSCLFGQCDVDNVLRVVGDVSK